jgi:hypothetical protein
MEFPSRLIKFKEMENKLCEIYYKPIMYIRTYINPLILLFSSVVLVIQTKTLYNLCMWFAMKKTNRFLLIAAVTLILPMISCMALTPPNTPTPTSTVIFAQELQTPGLPTETPPVDRDANCLKTAAGAVNVGDPCIVGTYAAHYNIFQRPTDHQTVTTDSLLQASIGLWAVSVGKLEGTAYFTYSLKSVSTDTKASDCVTTTDLVAPFTWDVNLKGQFFTQPDGSIQFLIQAAPTRGPDYLELFPDCPAVSPRHENGINFTGLGGQFEQGVFHSVIEDPIPSDATGRFYVEISLEVVK